jgi:putative ABC transport system permease protein
VLSALWRRFVQALRRGRADTDLAEEIESHRAMVQGELESRGVPHDDAVGASRRALGNITLAREDARQIWIGRWLESTWQDFQIGVRGLRRNPGFAAVALLTLALGIGVTTAMFTVVEAVLLRPLPYEKPDQLAMLWTDDGAQGEREHPTSFLTFADWRAQSRRFADMAIFKGEPVIVTGTTGAERVLAQAVSANLFSVLGVRPAAGRTFTSEEEDRGDPVVVISYGYCLRHFGSPSEAIGQSVVVQGVVSSERAHRVLGVMPQGFYFPSKDVKFWRPTATATAGRRPFRLRTEDRYRFTVLDLGVIGRLQAGATLADARVEMATIGQRLAAMHPAPSQEFPGFAVNVVPFREQLTGKGLERALWILFGAVGVVLLIASVNVANLLLARGTARWREFAIRGSLGASRGRLMRQSLTEASILAAAAVLVGLALASAGVGAFAAYAPPGVYPSASTSYALTDSVRVPLMAADPGIPRLDELEIDRRIVVFAVAVAILTVFLAGLVPAYRVSRSAGANAFFDGGRSIVGSRSLSRTRQILVAAECGLAVLLLVGAGLLIRSLARLDLVDPGYARRNILLLRVSVAPATQNQRTGITDDMELRRLFYQQVRARLASIQGVESVGQITDFFVRSSGDEIIHVPGRPAESAGDIGQAHVDGGFFTTMGVPLVRGRSFTDADVETVQRIIRTPFEELRVSKPAQPVIVNELFASRFFPGENPVGVRFGIGQSPQIWWYEIVGMVGNMRRDGLDRPPAVEIFLPYIGQTSELALRTTGDALALAPTLRDAIRAIDPNAIVMTVTTLERKLASLDATRRLQTQLLELFAVLSLLLAAVGIYGVVRYAVAQRTPEIGVRIALGARPIDVLTLVVAHGLAAPLAGLALGLVAAFWLTRILTSTLYETSPTDSVTLGAAVMTLLFAALVACVVPARRAARIDPVVALRTE